MQFAYESNGALNGLHAFADVAKPPKTSVTFCEMLPGSDHAACLSIGAHGSKGLGALGEKELFTVLLFG